MREDKQAVPVPEVVIFGGNGYLGRGLVMELLRRNHPVRVADLHDHGLPPDVPFTRVDIRDQQSVVDALSEGCRVVNFAGISDLNVAKKLPRECISVNVIGNLNLLEACVSKNVDKYIYASSAYVYSIHGSFYRISKRTSEEYIQEFNSTHGLDYVIVRYGSLYGGDSNDSNGMHRLITSALHEGRLRYDGNPTDSREFIHINDASEMTADLVLGEARNKAFLLTGAERMSMQQLFEMIREILNRPIELEFSGLDDSKHYRMTQYNFVPIEARKLSLPAHTDMGNGLIELINKIYQSRDPAASDPA
ncbi:NAD-dependent epimerase/dehydratase family protein [Radicibacter daui]|uniref:NAD-dependent epimerase/dehydratase family protein n=1 Tax=Radicibacter daui TaxID=3064829 RepID=UPI004047038E